MKVIRQHTSVTLLSLVLICIFPKIVYAASNWTGTTPLKDIPLPSVEKRYIINYDVKSIQDAYANPNQREGHSLAIEGKIVSVINSPKGQPNIELSLDENS